MNSDDPSFRISLNVKFASVRVRNSVFLKREAIAQRIVDVLVVRSTTLEDSPEKITNLLKGWFSALRYLREHPEQASQEMAERLQLEPPDVLASFDEIRLPDLDENLSLLGGTRPALVGYGRSMSLSS